MQTQIFDIDEDLADIERWWASHEQPFDISNILSEQGLIIPGVCAAWLYLSDGPIAWIELPVGNPDATPQDVHEGLKMIFEEFKEHAAAEGVKLLVANPSASGLIKVFERAGFVNTNTEHTKLFCGL